MILSQFIKQHTSTSAYNKLSQYINQSEHHKTYMAMLENNHYDHSQIAQLICLLIISSGVKSIDNLIQALKPKLNNISDKHYSYSRILKSLVESPLELETKEGKTLFLSLSEELISSSHLLSNEYDFKGYIPRHIGFEAIVKYYSCSEEYQKLTLLLKKIKREGWSGDWGKIAKSDIDKQMKSNIAKKAVSLGVCAEEAALNYLKNNNFKVYKFGKEHSRKKTVDLKQELISVPDAMLGISIVDTFNHSFSREDLFEGIEAKDLESTNYPTHLDLTKEELIYLAEQCKKSYPCRLVNDGSKNAACSLGKNMFEPNYLEKLTPNLSSGRMPKCFSIQFCQKRLAKIAALYASKNQVKFGNSFIVDNISIHLYIEKYRLKKLDEAQLDLLSGLERQKTVSRIKKEYKFNNHPGRYDFIVEKNGVLSAVEVKAGKSKISYWQKVRLALLIEKGHPAYELRVQSMEGGGFNFDLIKLDKIDLNLPTKMEFEQVLTYVPVCEAIQSETFRDTVVK